MKKNLVAALTGAMVMGVTATSFAAANPFSDVASDHWAYDAISQLAADGVVEGYGDGTYRGDRNITRYEMAQMVAKAMARTDVSATDKALIDKLAAEFSEELNNLGVRVSRLEKYADKVIWKGKMEYTYRSLRGYDKDNSESSRVNDNGLIFRLEPKAEINKNWTANARIDGSFNLKDDTNSSFSMKRGWAQGNYNNFVVKLGKFQLKPGQEHGLVWDVEMSGAMVTIGDKFKVDLLAGRISDNSMSERKLAKSSGVLKNMPHVWQNDIDLASSVQGIRIGYDSGKSQGFDGGLAYYRVLNDNFKYLQNNGKREDKANIWAVNAGYHFSPKAYLWANYARNGSADIQNNSWQVQFTYGDYSDAKKAGSWNVFAAYRKFGLGATIAGTVNDDVVLGTKGWAIGGAYAPMKNIGLLVKYYKGKAIDGNFDATRLFGRIEAFF